GAQSDLQTALANPALFAGIPELAALGFGNITPYSFDFTTSALEMFDLADGDDNELLDGGAKGLHEVSFQRNSNATTPASKRDDYFKGNASPGADAPPVTGDGLVTATVRLIRG